jgi:hypothetical protein
VETQDEAMSIPRAAIQRNARAALRMVADEARVEEEAVKAGQQSENGFANQYKAGTVNCLNVTTLRRPR